MNGHDGSGDQKDTKKKKKKEKPSTMSLDQFNKQIEEKKTHSDGRHRIIGYMNVAKYNMFSLNKWIF